MSKKKIKIRYIIFVLIIIGIVVFVGKITKLDDLNAEKVTEIILVSPPYKNISIGYYFLRGKHHSEQAEICHG